MEANLKQERNICTLVEQDRCCLDDGLKLKIRLSSPLKKEELQNHRDVSRLFWLEKPTGGIFRFSYKGLYEFFGIPHRTELILMAALTERGKFVADIEEFLPGFQDCYQSLIS